MNDAIMMRAVRALVLIVEGPSDEAALGTHTDDRLIGLVIAMGKENALRASSALDELGQDHTIRTLVDRDHDGDRGVGARVLVTDSRDLDTELLLAGTVLERIHVMFVGSPFDGARERLREHIASVAAPLSALVEVAVTIVPGLKATGIRLGGKPALRGSW